MKKQFTGIIILIFLITIGCSFDESPEEKANNEINLFNDIEHSVLNSPPYGLMKYETKADELFELIRMEEFDDVESFISDTVKNNRVTRDGIRYFCALLSYWFYSLERVTPFPEKILPHLNNWIKKNSKSSIAHIIRGTYHIDYAYVARGNGWAKDVNEDAWRPFKERLGLARTDLLKAIKLDPSNPNAYRQMIRVTKLLGTTDEDFDEYFQQAIIHAPNFYWAYKEKLSNLMPKWGGTWESMFDFAIETEKQAAPKTILPLILFEAHFEAAARSGNRKKYFSKPNVQMAINDIFQRTIKDYPHSGRWIVKYAQIMLYCDKEDFAKKYLDLSKKTDPQYYRSYEYLAWIYENNNNWLMSEKEAKTLTQLCPNYDIGFSLLGYSLMEQNNFSESMVSYKKAKEIKPGNSFYWQKLCYLYYTMGQYEKALEHCNKSIELNKNEKWAYLNRSDVHKYLGNTKESKDDAQMFEKLNAGKK